MFDIKCSKNSVAAWRRGGEERTAEERKGGERKSEERREEREVCCEALFIRDSQNRTQHNV